MGGGGLPISMSWMEICCLNTTEWVEEHWCLPLRVKNNRAIAGVYFNFLLLNGLFHALKIVFYDIS